MLKKMVTRLDSSHVFHRMTRLESQSMTRDSSQSHFCKISELWASAEIFPGGQRRHFAYHFSGCERCNANRPSQNALLCLDHKETSPWRQALRSHLFEIVFRWSCIRVCEKVVRFCHPLQFGWIRVAYHPIPLLLWTTDNWAWFGLEISTTAFAALINLCGLYLTSQNLVWNVSTLWLSEMLILFIN